MRPKDPKRTQVMVLAVLLFIIIVIGWARYAQRHRSEAEGKNFFSDMMQTVAPLFEEPIESFRRGANETINDEEFKSTMMILQQETTTTSATTTSE